MKMTKLLYIVIAIISLAITGFQFSEDPSFLKNLKATLQSYNASYPEEKIYLQFDKPFYKPGEDIWFNAVVLNSNTHKPTNISDVIYVELIDPKGNVAAKLDLVLNEGSTKGDFALLETAPGGLYKIKAYTHWMRNYGPENIFNKTLQVQRVITPRLLLKLDFEKESYGSGDLVDAKLTVTDLKNEPALEALANTTVKINGASVLQKPFTTDAKGVAKINFQLPDSLTTTDGLLQVLVSVNGIEESISRSIPIVLNKIAVQFFPEGGDAVANTDSRIAFQATNEFGKGADISGKIVDDQNNAITTFESFHMGMGAFKITMERDKNYFMRIEKPAGNVNLMPLPKPLTSGFSLRLVSENDSQIEWNVNSPATTSGNLVAQMHGNIVYAECVCRTAQLC
jgi:alpha-2-macroglobulin-like protein